MTTRTLEARTETCTFCPKLCRQACPVSNATPREALIPQQKMQMLHQLGRRRVPWTVEYTEPLYGCTGCGACRQVCALDNEVSQSLFEGRRQARERGVLHPALATLPERFKKRNERLRGRLREVVPRGRFAEEARVGFLPACDALAESPGDVGAAFRLFDLVGAGYVRAVEGADACLGYPLYAAGEMDAFRQHAHKQADALRRYAKVVTTCAGCAFATRAIYRREGIELPTEVVHLAEWAGDFVERLPERSDRPRALYHDPCHLGRQLGVMEGPRRLLARRAEVLEFSRNRGEAECCGGGGLVPLTMPATTRSAAEWRLVQARERGVTRVVTACATCKRTLGRVAGGIEIMDLAAALVEGVQGEST